MSAEKQFREVFSANLTSMSFSNCMITLKLRFLVSFNGILPPNIIHNYCRKLFWMLLIEKMDYPVVGPDMPCGSCGWPTERQLGLSLVEITPDAMVRLHYLPLG